MKRLIYLLLLLGCLAGCSGKTLEEYRREGRRHSERYLEILLQTLTYEDLAARQDKLELLFNQWVDTMIAARELEKRTGQSPLELTDLDRQISAQVRSEMERLYLIPGCRELMEECQEEALRRLDRAERG